MELLYGWAADSSSSMGIKLDQPVSCPISNSITHLLHFVSVCSVQPAKLWESLVVAKEKTAAIKEKLIQNKPGLNLVC